MISSLLLLDGGALPVIAMLAKTTAVIAMGLMAAWLARRSRAAVRHSILVVTFGGLLLLPLASSFAPRLNIPIGVVEPRLQTADLSVPLSVSEPGTPLVESSAVSQFSDGQQSRSLSGSNLLFAMWLLGVVLFLIPVAIGFRQSRAIRRTGLPWAAGQLLADCLIAETPSRRRVDVQFHEDLSGPIACGVGRPMILFPPDAAGWSDEDLGRAMVHELEHVRRADRVWHAFARVLCAVYWFHPLVWVAWRRLGLEAEKSCDDAVLARWDSAGYADQLMALARRLSHARHRSAHESYALAMASRSDLATRIYAMLDRGQRRGRAGAGAVVLSCCAAALTVVGLSAFRLAASPQTAHGDAAHGGPSFDVVSVKPAHSDMGGSWDNFPVNGTWTSKAMTVRNIVAYAYGIPYDRVEGVPKALQGADGFSIVSKMPLKTSHKDFLLMMQSLLAERFKAVIHKEVREVAANTIEVAKGGLKLRAASGRCVEAEGNASLPAGQHRCHEIESRPSASQDRTVTWEYSGWSVSMADLARKLSTGRVVVDDTGLTGLYDMDVKIEMRSGQDDLETQTNAEYAWRNAWEKQAGLVIDRTRTKKRPGTVVVVDHVEFPAPN